MKIDRNGYAPSILPTDPDRCFVCGVEGTVTVRHEIVHGTANRSVAKREGVWVCLCPTCHHAIHNDPDCDYIDKALKKTAQEEYLKTHTRAEWFKAFGRYYDD